MFLVERSTIPLGEIHYSTRILLLLYSPFLRRCVTYLMLYGCIMLSKSFVLLQVTYQLASYSLLQGELMRTSFESFH